MPREAIKFKDFNPDEKLTKVFKLKKAVAVNVDETNGHFEAYANVFDVIDRAIEMSRKGCFTKTIKDNGGNVALVWFHDVWEPIGLAVLEEDAKGLKLKKESFCDLNVQRGREVYSGIDKKYITHLSIGYQIIKAHWEMIEVEGKEVEVLILDELKLTEVSLLTKNMACNLEAQVIGTKAEKTELEKFKAEIAKLANRIDELEKGLVITPSEPDETTQKSDEEPGETHSEGDDFSMEGFLKALKKSVQETKAKGEL